MYIVYVYDKNWVALTQFFKVTDIWITKKINDVSTASFLIENKVEEFSYKESVPARYRDLNWEIISHHESKKMNSFFVEKTVITTKNDSSYKFLKEWNIAKIFKLEQIWETFYEKLFFEWIIKWVKADLEKSEVHLVDFLYLLKKKVIFSDRKNNSSIRNIIDDIKNEINWRDNGFIRNLHCSIQENYDKEFKKWRTFFDLLKELAWDTYEFKFTLERDLFFEKNLWVDRSSGPNFVSFEYNIISPESNNISRAEIDYDLDNIFNFIKGKNWIASDGWSIDNFWKLEKYSENENENSLLEEYKSSLKEYKIEPISNDFFLCEVWDFVSVKIDTGTDLMAFNWKLKVVEKNFKSWDLDTVIYKLNSSKIRTKDLFETISDLKNDVKELKL